MRVFLNMRTASLIATILANPAEKFFQASPIARGVSPRRAERATLVNLSLWRSWNIVRRAAGVHVRLAKESANVRGRASSRGSDLHGPARRSVGLSCTRCIMLRCLKAQRTPLFPLDRGGFVHSLNSPPRYVSPTDCRRQPLAPVLYVTYRGSCFAYARDSRVADSIKTTWRYRSQEDRRQSVIYPPHSVNT